MNPVEGQQVYENDYSSKSGFPRSSGPQSMVYFDYHSIPAYWDYAEEYGLADNYYAAVLGATTPNRLMLLTGDTPVSSNYGPPPYIQFNNTIFGQLAQAGISWGYYDYVNSAGGLTNTYPLSFITGMASTSVNINDVSAFLSELGSGSGLPQVSFLSFLGKEALDEHPPNSPTAGETQVVSVINAVMESKYWNSSAVFLTYDEGGGFYDHVTPPASYSVDHDFTSPLRGLGQRVPLLVISPFSKTNYVSHAQLSHLSLLHFIEFNWNIPPISTHVAVSNLPLDFFNFSQSPRPPIVLGSGPNSVLPYPIQLQGLARITVGGGTSSPFWLPLLGSVIAVSGTAAGAWVILQSRKERGAKGFGNKDE